MAGILLAVTLIFVAAPAHAQATRTWVSGVGDDANPCTRTSPCKTWVGAISKTAPGGEIDALDPGGFGALTITKSITLDGGGGQVASIIASGTDGIDVEAQNNDVVIIRNIRFDGLLGNGSNSAGSTGIDGIKFTSGSALVIENCVIFGFAKHGINFAPTSAAATATVINVVVENTEIGIATDSSGGQTALMTVENSSVTGSSSVGILNTGAKSLTTIDHTLVTLNQIGIESAIAGPLPGTGVLLSNSTVVENTGAGVTVSGTGVIYSYKNNNINGNNPDGIGSLTVIGQE
jgi:hypothetical protein